MRHLLIIIYNCRVQLFTAGSLLKSRDVESLFTSVYDDIHK